MTANNCKTCHSYALNIWKDGIETNGLCDLCYYKQDNARLRALIKEGEFSEGFCHWCQRDDGLHRQCRMFTDDGEVK